MPKEQAPKEIRVGQAGHFVCAIFVGPLTPEEGEKLDPKAFPAPLGNMHYKLGSKDSQIFLWHRDNFGMKKEDRLSSFRKHVKKEYAKPLPERTFVPKARNPGKRR